MRRIALNINDATLNRLLDRCDPALRTRVLTDLLDESPQAREVVAAKKRISTQPWVKATLAAHNGDGTWGRGFYHKYDGTSWALLHLSEVGAPMDHPAIRAGVERLLETARPVEKMKGAQAQPFEGLQGGYYWQYPIPCLVAHMALVLIRAGRADHPVTRGALALCRHRFERASGFGCYVIDRSLAPSCVMTVPKVLKAFLALPPPDRTAGDAAFIRQMVSVLRKFSLYKYAARDGAEWHRFARNASTAQINEAKPMWIAEGRAEPRQPKQSWLRFSFPHSYDSDLLEVLLLLGQAGARRDRVVNDGLRILLKKRGADGMWKMEGGLNGRMHASIDRRNTASPWITYRVALAFKQFGLLGGG